MDPALLHQRLDLLLKSSSCSSSGGGSGSTAQQAPLPPRRSTLDSVRFGGEVETATNERFRVGRHPATTTANRSSSSDVLSCQRQGKIRSSSRILIQSRSLQHQHHDSSVTTTITTESSSLSGSSSSTAALHSLTVDPSTTLRTCTANSISSTPELKPANPRHSAPPPPLPQSAASVKVSAMKKTRILNRIRRSASITFDLPPGGIVSSQQQQQRQDTTMVSSLSTTMDTTIAVASAAPSMTQPLHLVEQQQQQQLRGSTTATATVVATTTVATTPLGLKTPSQRPHPVTPRQSASTTTTTTTTSSTSSKKRKSNRPFPHLTLSSHKRPNQMVRLTDSDPTRILEQEYDLKGPGCKVIGHGAFSTVRSALCRRRRQSTSSNNDDDTVVMVAIKSISKFDAMKARRLRRPGSKHMDEWEIMKLLQDNPYTLSLLDLLETDEEIHLVTEYCAGGELFNAIKRKGISRCSFRKGRFSEQQASRITYQLLKALEEMHQHGIVHRDIKPENVLLLKTEDETTQDDIPVKLADFGVARVNHHHHDDSYAGHGLEAVSETASSDGDSSPSTPGLLLADKVDPPPEGCRGTCGPASDMFSLGVTLYILLCGFPPVFCENVVHFPDAYWDDISVDAKNLVRSMLRKDPEQRITAADASQHEWIRQEQAPRGRRGSMCANLELVRSQLAKTLQGTTSATTTAPVTSSLASSNGKRSLRNAVHYTSPKRAKRHAVQLPMTELFNCQQQEKRDARVTKEPAIDAAAIVREAAADGVKVACN